MHARCRDAYEDLGGILNVSGLTAVSERLAELLRERRPSILVIDSFKALTAYASASDFRRFLHEVGGRLSVFPVSSFWVCEYAEHEFLRRRSSRSPTP